MRTSELNALKQTIQVGRTGAVWGWQNVEIGNFDCVTLQSSFNHFVKTTTKRWESFGCREELRVFDTREALYYDDVVSSSQNECEVAIIHMEHFNRVCVCYIQK